MMNLMGYIDPMSGAMVLQLIIAGIAGALAFFRKTIFGAFRGIAGQKSDGQPSE